MKVITIITCLFFIPLFVKSQSKKVKQFILEGQLHGRDSGFIWLRYWDKGGKEIRDTTYLQDGKFAFKGRAEEPTLVTLIGNITGKYFDADDPNLTEIFIEPKKMFVELHQNNFKTAKVTGALTQDQLSALDRKKIIKRKKFDSLSVLYKTLVLHKTKGDSTVELSAIKSELSSGAKKYISESKNMDLDFIKSHPDSYLSPYLLYNLLLAKAVSLPESAVFFNSFTERIKNSQFGAAVQKRISNVEQPRVGVPAYAFKRTDYKGKLIHLKDFKGRYVLLDFWASWCVPCRQFFPELKRIFAEYEPKGLSIISVSSDEKKNNWINAIKKDDIGSWVHILSYDNAPESLGHESENNLLTRYNVRAIPVLILIDPEGKIVGRYIGEGNNGDEKDLFQKLAEIL